MEDVNSAVRYLAENHHKKTYHPKVREAIQIINNNNNVNITELIQQQYRPTEIEIETAGSYLWGSSQIYYGDVNKSCSPLYIGSYNGQNKNNDTCQYSIWTYNVQFNDLKRYSSLVNILDIASPKAYIYVDSNWTGFQNKDIEFLKSKGIYYAAILSTYNSQHKIILQMTSVDNLPVSKEYYGKNINDLEREEKIPNNQNSYFWILFLFILIGIGAYYIVSFQKM